MKKELFVFFVTFLSVLAIFWTLKSIEIISNNKIWKEIEIFLSSSNKLFYYNESNSTFDLKRTWSDYFYQSINPIDWVYYKAQNFKALRSATINWKTTFKITKWEFVFVLNDIFSKYDIEADGFRISQLWKWMFYVNNTWERAKIFSFNSLLNITLLSGKDKISTFELFPSLYFEYNPSYNSVLKNVDILRISTINRVVYIDWKEENVIKFFFPEETGNNILKIAYKDTKDKVVKFWKFYSALLWMEMTEIANYWLIKGYEWMLQNKTKKEILYKNITAKNISEILRNDVSKNDINDTDISVRTKKIKALDDLNKIKIGEISKILSSTEDNPTLKNDCIEIIKNYYYISYFWNVMKSGKKPAIEWMNNVDAVIKNIFWNSIVWTNHFSTLSEIFFAYDFSEIKPDELDVFIYTYLKDLWDKKIIKDNKDYLSFSFFLSLYANSNSRISVSSVNILLYFLEVFNNYFITLKDPNIEKENAQKFSALSMHYYDLSKILLNFNNNLLKKFFEKDWKSVVLKKDYYKDNSTSRDSNIWTDLLDNINLLNTKWLKEIEDKEKFYVQQLSSFDSVLATKNNFIIVNEKFKVLSKILYMLNSYGEYYELLKLDEKDRDAQALVKDNSYIYSAQDAQTYLAKFNGLAIDTLNILNEGTMKDDWFYNLEIKLLDNVLTFNLYPDWHIIKNIVITVNNEKNELYKKQVMNLDEKELVYSDKLWAANTDEERSRYDFKNFFINAFINSKKQNDINVTAWNNVLPEWPQETKEVSLFKQGKLIDWDFTNLWKMLKIPFNKIKVTINNGARDITIDSIRTTFKWENDPYQVEFNSKYNFTEHSFEGITYKVLNDWSEWYSFDWVAVEIIPESINVKDFTKIMGNLWYYLDVLRSNFRNWDSIKFDLNLKQVSIDSVNYPVLIK